MLPKVGIQGHQFKVIQGVIIKMMRLDSVRNNRCQKYTLPFELCLVSPHDWIFIVFLRKCSPWTVVFTLNPNLETTVKNRTHGRFFQICTLGPLLLLHKIDVLAKTWLMLKFQKYLAVHLF